MCDGVDFNRIQCVAVRGRIAFARIGLEALFHRTQVEKKLALGFGRGDLDHAPIFQNVFVNFGLDPVHGVAHQAHALVGIETFDSLHQAHIAFLNQVSMGQAIAQVLARHGHHQTQVREHQLSSGLEVVVVAQLAGKLLLLLQRQHGQAVRCRDVRIDVAQWGHHRPRVHDGEGSSMCQICHFVVLSDTNAPILALERGEC